MAGYITTYGGDGYFELGSITINENTIFKFKATPRIAPEGFWLGNWSNWYGIYHPVQSNIQNQLKWYSTGSREGVFYEGQSLTDILDHSFEIETSTEYVKVNGTTVSRYAPINQTFTSFHIGNSANAGQFDASKPVEWEYFQIYQNGVLSLDLVPAFNNNQYCFKDKVTGNYIYGTGTIGGDVTSFSIDIDNITAEYSGTSTSVTVTSDEELSWTASTNDSWISLTNPSGTGDGGFTVAVAENNNYSNRTGTVIITSSEGYELTVTVEQEKKPVLVYDRPIYRSGNLVKKMYRSGELIYLRLNPISEEPEPSYGSMPLTFEILTGGTIVWKATNSSVAKTIQYSLDSGSTWSNITSTTNGVSITVAQGDTIQFKGNNSTYGSSSYHSTFSGSTAVFNIYGNIMSLINGSDFEDLITFTETYNFYGIFRTTNVISAENLILPAKNITTQCYRNMFIGCTSLTTAPELPATTLSEGCYMNMFLGCSALVKGPVLPAPILTQQCYQGLFNNCSNLTYIKCLATNITATNCTNLWVSGVASTGTFVKDASMTGWTTGASGIPSGWTVVSA